MVRKNVGSLRVTFAIAAVAGTLASPAAAPATCAPNHFFWGVFADQNLCPQCPSGYTSPGCTDCIADPNQESCVSTSASNCAAGAYFNGAFCNDCPAGKWQSETGKSNCHVCGAGEYSFSKKSTGCVQCEVGKFQSDVGTTGCSTCASCSKGQFVNSPIGSAFATDCICDFCQPGSVVHSGTKACAQCDAGRWMKSPLLSLPYCYKCAIGKYSGVGAADCTSCPAGKTTYKSEALESDCLDSTLQHDLLYAACGDGQRLVPGSTSTCEDCPIGTYSTPMGNTHECRSCTTGFYNNEVAQARCTECPAGRHSNAEHTGCHVAQCYAGYIKTLDAATQVFQCVACTAGQYKSPMKVCEHCPAGKYSATGKSICQDCAVGTISTAGSSSCTETTYPTAAPTYAPTPRDLQPGIVAKLTLKGVSVADFAFGKTIFENRMATIYGVSPAQVTIRQVRPQAPLACEHLVISGDATVAGEYLDHGQKYGGKPYYYKAATTSGAQAAAVPHCTAVNSIVHAGCGQIKVAAWAVGAGGVSQAVSDCNNAATVEKRWGNCADTSADQYVFWLHTHGMWVVSNHLGSTNVEYLSHQATESPASVSQWFTATGSGFAKAPNLQLTCMATPVTDVTVQVEPMSCDAQGSIDLKGFAATMISTTDDPAMLTNVVRDIMGQTLSTIILENMHVNPCIMIDLTMPDAPNSKEENVQCHFTGSKIEIDHQVDGNENLACSHHYSKENNEWNCKCRSTYVKPLIDITGHRIETGPVHFATFAPTPAPDQTAAPEPAPVETTEQLHAALTQVHVGKPSTKPFECKHKVRYRANADANRTAYEEMAHHFSITPWDCATGLLSNGQ
jgi:hypothetical protein